MSNEEWRPIAEFPGYEVSDSCDGCWPCPEDHRRKPSAPVVAPDSPSPVVVDPPEVSGPQNGTQRAKPVDRLVYDHDEGGSGMSGVYQEIITIPGLPEGSFLRVRTDSMGRDVHIRMGDGADEYASVWFDWDEITKLSEALSKAVSGD